jgi:thioredoxin reductase (NADPH)
LKIMQGLARENNKITWSFNKTPLEVITGERGVTGLKVRDNATNLEEIIGTDGIFVTIGHTPNTIFLNGQLDLDINGYIIVKPGSSKTNFQECLPAATS